MTDFDRAMEFVLKWEGGYVNNPFDPGGETKFGISKGAYPMLDISTLQEEDARLIYRKDYWEKAGCDKLEWPMCLIVFDTAVNMGVRRALEIKEKSFNWTDYLFLRIALYNGLNKSTFLKGWINRVLDLWKTIKAEEHPISGGA